MTGTCKAKERQEALVIGQNCFFELRVTCPLPTKICSRDSGLSFPNGVGGPQCRSIAGARPRAVKLSRELD
jgi:hypothetical protein